ncbi:MAG: DNA-formamidopyrimidine glycosylase [Lachnospiraceae bacterium]|nr:DNA-formamidopyrimidine glycosylase [Lachnospiraceae bacterium]
MPELPEVETVRRTLKNFILNKKITDITVIYDKIISGETGKFVEAVRGQTIRDIDRAGKYLIFVLDDVAFVSHLRMEGKYNIVSTDTEIKKHEHIIFRLDDGNDLRYHDTRKFGRIELKGRGTYREELPLSKLGAEPAFADADLLFRQFKKSRLPIKSLLLDQSILSGIGNIYANEICYRMKLHPETLGTQMTKNLTQELLSVAAEVLDAATKLGGTTIHSFDAGGITGRFQSELLIHTQKVCPKCQAKVTKITVGGRGTYFCENCQKREM